MNLNALLQIHSLTLVYWSRAMFFFLYGEAGSVAGIPRGYAPLGPGSIPSPGAACAFGFQSKLASAGFLRVPGIP